MVRVPLVSQTVLGVVITIVGRENNQRVVQDALVFKFFQDSAACRVHFGRQAIVILHHRLEFFRRVETPMPAVATFVFLIRNKLRQPSKRFFRRIDGNRDLGVRVEFHALRLRQKLKRVLVFRVSRKECKRQAKRLVLWTIT